MNFHQRDDSSNSSDASSSGSGSSESGSSVSSMQINHALGRTGGQWYFWSQWGVNVIFLFEFIKQQKLLKIIFFCILVEFFFSP